MSSQENSDLSLSALEEMERLFADYLAFQKATAPMREDEAEMLLTARLDLAADAMTKLTLLLFQHAPALLTAARERDGLRKRVAGLEAALKAMQGYLLNAKIDLETGATKRTAICTIEGGLKRARAALGEPTDG